MTSPRSDPGVRISRRRLLGLALAAAGGLSAYSYVECIRLLITRMKLGLGAKVAFLADTHTHVFGSVEEAVVKAVEAERPDIILHGGDIIDEFTGSLKPLENYLSSLDADEKYAVLGNHDHWSGRVDEIAEVLRESGFRLLVDEEVETSVGSLLGLDWRDSRSYSLETDADIVLVHDPNAALGVKGGRLVLAGHTHGGIVVAGITLFSNSAFSRGLYDLGGGRVLYVSRGLGQMIPLRPTSPLELVIIE